MKTFTYSGAGSLMVLEPGQLVVKMVGISTAEQLTRLLLQECRIDPFFNGPPFLDEVLAPLGGAGKEWTLTAAHIMKWYADRVAASFYARVARA